MLQVKQEMNSNYVKIEFQVVDEKEVHIETLWAEKTGSNEYRLDNCPFFAYNVSYNDIIEAIPSEDGMLTFTKIIKKSGNRTIRIVFAEPVIENIESKKILDKLVELGCDYEGANPKYIVVNIPPQVDFWKVREYLIQTDIQWEHADPSYSKLFPE